MKSFLDRCACGEANIEDFGKVISSWYIYYNKFDRQDLYEYIGLTWDEYLHWVNGDAMVPYKKLKILLERQPGHVK